MVIRCPSCPKMSEKSPEFPTPTRRWWQGLHGRVTVSWVDSSLPIDSSWLGLDLSEPITQLLPSRVTSLSPFYLIHPFSRSIHLFSWNALVQNGSNVCWNEGFRFEWVLRVLSQVGPSLRPETHLSARSLGLLWLLLRSPTITLPAEHPRCAVGLSVLVIPGPVGKCHVVPNVVLLKDQRIPLKKRWVSAYSAYWLASCDCMPSDVFFTRHFLVSSFLNCKQHALTRHSSPKFATLALNFSSCPLPALAALSGRDSA